MWNLKHNKTKQKPNSQEKDQLCGYQRQGMGAGHGYKFSTIIKINSTDV